MSSTEYYQVFQAIFYSLILANILTGWGKMIRVYPDFKLYWMHLLITIAIFLNIIQVYSSELTLDGIVDYPEVKRGVDMLLVIVLAPSLLFLAAFLSFPQKMNGVNFKEFFLSNRWKIVLPIACYGMIQFIDNLLEGLGAIWLLPTLLFVIVAVLATAYKKIRVLEVLVIAWIIQLCYYLLIT